MKYSKRVRKVKTYRRYLYAFAVACLIMVVFSLGQYMLMHKSLKNAYSEVYREQLLKFKIEMDNICYNMQRISDDIINSEIYTICNRETLDAYDYQKLMDYSASKCVHNDYIEDVLFYIKNNGFFVSKNGTDTRFGKLYTKDGLTVENELSAKAQLGFFKLELDEEEAGINQKKAYIIYTPRMDVFKGLRVFVVLDAKKINRLFGKNFAILSEQGFLYASEVVMDFYSENPLSTEYDGRVKLGREMYLCMEDESEFETLRYIAFIPQDEMSVRFDDFIVSFLMLTAFFLAVLFLYSYFMSNSLYRPIKNLSELIKTTSEAETVELEDFYAAVTKMNEDYISTVEKYNRVFENYRDYYIRERLNGGFNKALSAGGNDIERVLEESDYFLISVRLSPKRNCHMGESGLLLYLEEAISLIKDFIADEFRAVLNIEANIVLSSYEYVAVVTASDNFEDFTRIKERLNALFSNEFSENVYANIVVGNIYRDEDMLNKAYTRSIYVYDYFTIVEESSILLENDRFFDNIEELSTAREKLISHITAKRYDKIADAFSGLIYSAENGKVSIKALRQCYMEMQKCLSDKFELYKGELSGETIRIGQDILKAVNRVDFVAITEKIGGIMSRIEQTGDKNTSAIAIEKITEYINEHYGEDLYLDFFAEKYDLSSIYLSRIFKQQMGKNFSSYIRDVRLGAAKDIIEKEGSECNVAKLAERVGYRSLNNFISAFKACYGYTPGAYRDNIVNKN